MVTRRLRAPMLMVTAAMMAGCSLPAVSNVTAPTPPCVAPGPVGFVGWTTATVPPGALMLTWEPAAGVVTSYIVQLGTTLGASNVGSVEVSGTARSHTFHRLSPGDYFGRVTAKNECGTGPTSNEAFPRVR